jgi:hypothetical protein
MTYFLVEHCDRVAWLLVGYAAGLLTFLRAYSAMNRHLRERAPIALKYRRRP